MMKKSPALLAGLLCVVLSSKADPNFPPNLPDNAKAAYKEKYEPASRDKAFAVTKDGAHFYYVFGLQTPERAARTASLRCLTAHGVPCLVWMINGDDVLSAYQKATDQSEKAIAALPVELTKKAYADEDNDMGVAGPQTFRDGAEVHGATPTAAPAGSKTISTQELVKLYKSDPGLVVLDSLHINAAKKQSLPGANWLHGAGWAEAKVNTTIEKNFAKAMAAIAPSKDTPIVSYCENWECWLSWNAAMRLSVLGYSRIYWYRGGIDAWKAAKLPLVDTPITAQLW